MLEQARCKTKGQGNGRVLWIEGRAETLPVRNAALDCVTLGFALRHLNLDAVLQEVLRVLRPGGRFVLVEWTRPEAVISRRLFLGYMRWVVAPLVRLVSRDRLVGELAAYLPETIEQFMTGKALVHRFEVAGFRVIKLRSYFFGLVSLCVGLKGNASEKFSTGKIDGPSGL
jgi:ubiquinone/menaquinone biosynthesis C-methylase UbiE